MRPTNWEPIVMPVVLGMVMGLVGMLFTSDTITGQAFTCLGLITGCLLRIRRDGWSKRKAAPFWWGYGVTLLIIGIAFVRVV